ncbi:unnamed protein product [Linum trigynum]|uniref:Kinesin motor domain-containing protein n=1 Tax=Linum trigynum TaxID=586398 RepID=A0AAV2F9P0_9ROSI
MEGPNVLESDDMKKGLFPRVVDGLFEHLASAGDSIKYKITLSMVEIYMEKVRDLFDLSKDNLVIKQNKDHEMLVSGVTKIHLSDTGEALQNLHAGIQNRAVGETQMNLASSRSHCAYIFTVLGRTGKLVLVDLAGSQKVEKTGAEGKLLEEAKTINKSLSALGNVINALTCSSSKSNHIPYRNSKLTRLLQDALGGNSRTALICCCSPSTSNSSETFSTLRFGTRAKHIKTSPRTTTPEIPDPIVEPQAIWSLSWLKLHWVEIVLGLLSFGISVAILVLTYLGFHENRTHSHLIGLAFLPAGVTFVHFILSSIYVYCGKEWKKEKIAFLAQAWYSKTVFQLLGFVFGGFTNELIAKVKLPAVLMFLYSFYVMCSSQYTKFPFSLDVTSTWLSSTAIVAFDTSRSSKKFWYPWGLIIGLVGIMVVRNICDRPAPNEDVVEDPDVEEPLIG